VGEISMPIVGLLTDRTYGIHLTAIHCAAAERDGLIKKKRKIES